MRLPFVPRSTFDALQDQLEKSEIRESQWVARHDELLVRCTDLLKRQVPEPPVLKGRNRDDVIEAILSKAGTNGAVRSHLSAWATAQRRAGVPDTEIIPQIVTWASADDGEGDGASDGDH